MSHQQKAEWLPAHPCEQLWRQNSCRKGGSQEGLSPPLPITTLPLLLLGNDSWRWWERPGPGDERGC